MARASGLRACVQVCLLALHVRGHLKHHLCSEVREVVAFEHSRHFCFPAERVAGRHAHGVEHLQHRHAHNEVTDCLPGCLAGVGTMSHSKSEVRTSFMFNPAFLAVHRVSPTATSCAAHSMLENILMIVAWPNSPHRTMRGALSATSSAI